MDTIREQILSNIITRLGEIRPANGFNTDCGADVVRARKNLDPDELPALAVWPGQEESARQYGNDIRTMPIQVEALALFADENPSVLSEKMLGDLIECMCGITWTLPFTSGGPFQIQAGHLIEGNDSGAVGYVAGVTLASGAWETGDAAGTLTLRRLKGDFQAETLKVGAEEDAAATNGDITGESAVETATGGLADQIEYAGGGADEYPEAGEETVGCPALFKITYHTLSGDPYTQP